MNFTEWTNKVEELETLRNNAWQRWLLASDIRQRAHLNHLEHTTETNLAIYEFTREIDNEAYAAYVLAQQAWKAVLDERVSPVTDSEVPAGYIRESVTNEDGCIGCDGVETVDIPEWIPVDQSKPMKVESVTPEELPKWLVLCLQAVSGTTATDWRREVVENEVQKDGAVYRASNGWYVTPSHNCFFDWFVYRDDGCLFTFAVTLDAAKRLADEGRESR